MMSNSIRGVVHACCKPYEMTNAVMSSKSFDETRQYTRNFEVITDQKLLNSLSGKIEAKRWNHLISNCVNLQTSHHCLTAPAPLVVLHYFTTRNYECWYGLMPPNLSRILLILMYVGNTAFRLPWNHNLFSAMGTLYFCVDIFVTNFSRMWCHCVRLWSTLVRFALNEFFWKPNLLLLSKR